MTREDKAVFRAAIELMTSSKAVRQSRNQAARTYRGVHVTVDADSGKLPAGIAMDLAKFLADYGFRGKAQFSASIIGAGQVFSGIHLVKGWPDMLAIEMTFCKNCQAVRLWLYVTAEQYDKVIYRFNLTSDNSINELLLVDKITDETSNKETIYLKTWSEETLKQILDNLQEFANQNGEFEFKALCQIVMERFQISSAIDGRTLYFGVAKPMIEAGHLTRISKQLYRLNSAPFLLPEVLSALVESDADELKATRAYTLVREAQAAKRALETLEVEDQQLHTKQELMYAQLTEIEISRADLAKRIESAKLTIDQARVELEQIV